MISTGTFSQSPAGSYLRSLESSFTPVIRGTATLYLHLSLELSARQGRPAASRDGISGRTRSAPAQFKELKFLSLKSAAPGKWRSLRYWGKAGGIFGKCATGLN